MPNNAIRFLHAMLRVKNLEESIKFYTKFFGLHVIRQADYTEGRFTLAFLGFQDESTSTVIELTYNWDKQEYDKGNAFGHLAFEVSNIIEFCQWLKNERIKVTRDPGPMMFDNKEIIAFIEDPDGYKIELIQLRTRA